MVVSIYIENHPYLFKGKPQTINLGGKYIYNFENIRDELYVSRKSNKKYIKDFFKLGTSTTTKISNLSAFVGENGAGKTSIIKEIINSRSSCKSHNIFDSGSRPKTSSDFGIAILVEDEKGETQVLDTNFKTVLLKDGKCKISKYSSTTIESLYYSPFLNFKEENIKDGVSISANRFFSKAINDAKSHTEKALSNIESIVRYKGGNRIIDLLQSDFFNRCQHINEIFPNLDLKYGHVKFQSLDSERIHNMPLEYYTLTNLIYSKIDEEGANWMKAGRGLKISKEKNLAERKYLLKLHFLKSFFSVIREKIEYRNSYLNSASAYISTSDLGDLNSKELFLYFLKKYEINGKHKFNVVLYESLLEKTYTAIEEVKNLSEIDDNGFYTSFESIKEILELQQNVNANLNVYYFSNPERDELVNDFIYYDADRNLSSGESAFLTLFSNLYDHLKSILYEVDKKKSKSYIFFIDEGDLGFHPLWKKKYINIILNTIPNFFDLLEVNVKIQIVIATHDPLTLSDIPSSNVVFITKDKSLDTADTNRPNSTFGANISDLLANSFFINDGLIGDFAKTKISAVIKWINENKNNPSRDSRAFKSQLETQKKVINLIDERVVRIKLLEMISEVEGDTNAFNDQIDAEIKRLIKLKRLNVK